MLESFEENKLYLKGLDGLRALCALCIVVGHISQKDFCDWGGRDIYTLPVPSCCAYVFFVISGFLAGFRTKTGMSFVNYYRKKAYRLLPLYFFYVILVIVVYSSFGWGKDVLNGRLFFYLLLMPEMPFCNSTGILPLVHLWFLGVLVLFYVLVPILAKVDSLNRKRVSLILAVCWFILKAFSYFVFGKESFIYRFCGTACFDILFFSFFAGVSLRNLQNRGAIIAGGGIQSWWSTLPWALFLCSGLYDHYIPAPIRPEYVSLLSLLIIIGLQSSPPIILRENKLFRRLGRISYEIYVVHVLVIILLSKLYLLTGVELPDAVIYICCIIVVVGCAWMTERLFASFLGLLVRN